MHPKTTNFIVYGSIAFIFLYVFLSGPDDESNPYSARVIFLGIVLTVIITVVTLLYRKQLRKRCNLATTATITKIVPRGLTPQNSILTITYTDPAGMAHTSNLEYTNRQLGSLTVGSQITIMINPNKPRENFSFDYPVPAGAELPQ
jgi:hypothetical protein